MRKYILIYGLFLLMLLSFISGINSYFISLFCLLSLFNLKIYRQIDFDAVLLVLFSIFFTWFYYRNGHIESKSNIIGYLFGPFLFYCTGKNEFKISKDEKDLLVFIFIIILASSIHLYYSTIRDLFVTGIINADRYLPTSNTNNDGEIAATFFGTVSSLGLTGISVFLNNRRGSNRKIAMGFLILSLLSLLTNVHLINRTGIIVFAIAFFISLLYLSPKRFYRSILLFLIIFIILYHIQVLFSPFDSILDAYSLREESEMGSISAGGDRVWRWKDSLPYLISSPFGWKTNKYVYVHNLFLDIAKDAGIIPMVIIAFVSIRQGLISLQLFKKKNSILNITLVCITTCMMIVSFVEPLIQSSPLYFYLLCLFWGMQRQLHSSSMPFKRY